MSKINDILNEEIVAITCKDLKKNKYIFRLPEPIPFKKVILEEDLVIAGNIYVPCQWFDTVAVCTQQMLSEVMGDS